MMLYIRRDRYHLNALLISSLQRMRVSRLRKMVDRSNFDDAPRKEINVGISRTALDPLYDSRIIALYIPNIWKEIL